MRYGKNCHVFAFGRNSILQQGCCLVVNVGCAFIKAKYLDGYNQKKVMLSYYMYTG
jgi:hypothetical protein